MPDVLLLQTELISLLVHPKSSFDFPIFINPIILLTFPKQEIMELPLVSLSLSLSTCSP